MTYHNFGFNTEAASTLIRLALLVTPARKPPLSGPMVPIFYLKIFRPEIFLCSPACRNECLTLQPKHINICLYQGRDRTFSDHRACYRQKEDMGKYTGPANSRKTIADPKASAFVAKALADENRLRIVLSLTGGKKPVSRIVEELGISQPLASHHLKELKRALLVRVERSGPFIYYELADSRIATILADLNNLAADLLANRTTF